LNSGFAAPSFLVVNLPARKGLTGLPAW